LFSLLFFFFCWCHYQQFIRFFVVDDVGVSCVSLVGRLAASFAPVLKVGVRPLEIDVSLDLDLDDGSGPFAFGTLQDRFLDVIF
jgi:hypothetical protein